MEQEKTIIHPVIAALLEKGVAAKPYLDIVGVMIGVIDAAGIVRSINKKGCDILGRTEEDILGANWIDQFVTENHRAKVWEVLGHLIAGNIAPFQYFENDVQDVYGNVRNIAFHNEVLRDPDGKIVGVLFAGEDITHHKKMEKQLVEQANMLEAISDNLPIGYSVNTISDGKVVFMNKKFEEIYGWPREVIVDVNTFFDKVYPEPEFRKKIKEQVMMDIMSATPARMKWEKLLITKQSGETAYITAQNIPLYEDDLMISTVWDVSRQVALEKELRESYGIQKAIVDSIPDVIWMKDVKGVYLTVNKAFLKRIGKTSRDQVVGKTDFDFWPKEYAEKYRADDVEVAEYGTEKRMVETVPNLEANTIQVETIKTPVYGENGVLIGIAGVARDITNQEKHA